MVDGPALDQPDFDTLVDWVEGRLAPARAAQVAAQVATGDLRLTAAVNWLRQFRSVTGTIASEDPPPAVRQALVEHFARWKQSRDRSGEQFPTIVARLVFDSRYDLAASGVRGGADDTAHLAYSCEEADVLVDLTRPAPGRVSIDGQILLFADHASAQVFHASVTGPGFTRRSTDSDGLGRFTVHDVPETRSELRAGNGEVTIVAQLDLRFDSGRHDH